MIIHNFHFLLYDSEWNSPLWQSISIQVLLKIFLSSLKPLHACCLEVVWSCRHYTVCRLFCSNILQSLRWKHIFEVVVFTGPHLWRGSVDILYCVNDIHCIEILRLLVFRLQQTDRHTVTVSYFQSVCCNRKTSKSNILLQWLSYDEAYPTPSDHYMVLIISAKSKIYTNAY